jgi:hypothetical protein
MFMKVLGFIHLLMFAFTATYVFLFPQTVWFDKLFILYFIVVNLHWFFLNGECLIAYVYTKYFTDSYTLGEKPTQNQDIVDILGGTIPNYYIEGLILCLLGLYLYNIYVVLLRNHFDKVLTIALVISYIIYILSMRLNIDFSRKYSYFHFFLYACALVIYIRMLVLK